MEKRDERRLDTQYGGEQGYHVIGVESAKREDPPRGERGTQGI